MLLATRCVPVQGVMGGRPASGHGSGVVDWADRSLPPPPPFPPFLSSSRPAASLRAVRSAVAAAPTLRRAPTALRAIPPRTATVRAMASSAAADWAKTVSGRERMRGGMKREDGSRPS